MHELKEVIALHHSKIGEWILPVNTNLIWEKKMQGSLSNQSTTWV